jgi:bifunctional UDP-N-acetylglucosamine pyrophosphorylase/glucosamine-1-phosphate N-acetyltransferase
VSSKARALGAVVLAAGRSKRFKGTHPKVLHPLCGRPIVVHVLETLRELHRSARISSVVVVVPPGKEVERALAGLKFPFTVTYAVQKQAGGTGEAAAIGLKKLPGAEEVLVLAGDVPLVRADSLLALVRTRRDAKAAGALLSTVLSDGGPYGRILRSDSWITGIVEARDATPEQLAIREINTCIYAFARDALAHALPKVKPDNVQKERYLTDVIGALIADGQHVTSVEGQPSDVLGTNTRGEFAAVARLARERIVADLMDAGVTVIDPDATYVDAGVIVGVDTVLHPNTYLEGNTKIGPRCEIGPNARLVDTTVAEDAVVTFAVAREARIGPEARVGPFATLRPGTVLARGVEVGSFGEMKNAQIGEGVKVHHFSYLGDVSVGRGTNIGAGTITCNYDGKKKHATKIGEDAFIGSDTILVAPVRVGRGAYTGAGSVVNRDVAAGELVYGVPAKTKTKRRTTAKKKAAKRPTKATGDAPKVRRPANQKRKRGA